jgi:hypothetical protein
VHQLAHLTDVILENTVGRRIGDHDRGEIVGVRGDLGLEVGQIDFALVATGGHHDDLHSRQYRRGSVRPMCAGRDQADVAVIVTAAAVVVPDGEQAGELTLGTRVGLQ